MAVFELQSTSWLEVTILNGPFLLISDLLQSIQGLPSLIEPVHSIVGEGGVLHPGALVSESTNSLKALGSSHTIRE